MVYLNLSVRDIAQSSDFYCSGLGLFEEICHGRINCIAGPELIIDLVQEGINRHIEQFGTPEFCPSSFWIHIETQEPNAEMSQLRILDRLHELGISYELTENLGGSRISLKDPSGNRVGIHTHCGDLV